MNLIRKERTCRECLWFLQGQNGEGECRQAAPVPYGGPASHTRLQPIATWPIVQNFDWCGMWTNGRDCE
jgi:hypothetical protein